MVAALTRVFGVHNLALAEDVVQDAFCRALEVWKFRGPPDNPAAWLMAAAKNRAIDTLRRERTTRTYAPEVGRLLQSEWTLKPAMEELFGPEALKDDLLRMMFSCCHPRVPEEGQVALMLHILCGFSLGEVAGAFLATSTAVAKRITRAKKVLASSPGLFDVTNATEVATRLPAVLRALYLLFNEGYHGASAESAVRAELCEEAIRLADVLLEHPAAATPAAHALAALMHLHAARLPARLDDGGDLHPYADQDRFRWNQACVARGQALLERSATGLDLTVYHVEAAIAWQHASAPRAEDTDWGKIVALYDTLLRLRPSPVVALNRAIAVAQHSGPERGLAEIRAIPDVERLAGYPFYPAALGELELRRGQCAVARRHFELALALARNPTERRFFGQRIAACAPPVLCPGARGERQANPTGLPACLNDRSLPGGAMSLKEELAALKARAEAKRPPEVVALMHRAVDDLRRSGAVERVARIGDRAPEFTLPNAEERLVSSQELLARGPLVVTFYRGGW